MITDLVPLIGRRFGPDLDHPIGQFWMTDSVEPAATEVVERLKNHVLPWFSNRSSESEIANCLRDATTGDRISNLCALARILVKMGRHQEAPEVLAQAREELRPLNEKYPNRPDVCEAYRSMIAATDAWVKAAESKR